MGCAQCQHENRPDASFCDKCGYPLLHLWPQADLRPRAERERARHRRPPPRLIEIAAAIGVVVTGLSVIAGIVVASPSWQRIIASWRESFATRFAVVRPAIGTAAEQMRAPAINGLAPERATPQPVPARPARIQETMRAVERAPVRAQADSTQVMASLLVSQLGQDPAWRTALANADAHAPDSPEHAYWRGVATAIRDGGGLRTR